MRCTCPHCSKRFDVPHREVLSEAARLAEQRKAPYHPGPSVSRSTGPEVNGNVLAPADAEGRRERAERLARRGVKP